MSQLMDDSEVNFVLELAFQIQVSSVYRIAVNVCSQEILR